MMKMKRQRIKSAFCLLCMVCACLFVFCGCSAAEEGAAAAATTTAGEESTAPDVTEPAEKTTTKQQEKSGGAGVGLKGAIQIEQVDGVEVVYGKVERVSGSMVYAPSDGSGYFSVNGTIADDSIIEIAIHPTGVLRYSVTLNVQEEKTVNAEIRVFKKGEQLVSCVNPQTALQQGANTIDVCIDTGEGAPCHGTYDLYLYLDGHLVRTDIYEA